MSRCRRQGAALSTGSTSSVTGKKKIEKEIRKKVSRESERKFGRERELKRNGGEDLKRKA